MGRGVAGIILEDFQVIAIATNPTSSRCMLHANGPHVAHMPPVGKIGNVTGSHFTHATAAAGNQTQEFKRQLIAAQVS